LIEQYQPEEIRLFSDSVIQYLVGDRYRAMMQLPTMRILTLQQTEFSTKGIVGALICRTRYIDDVVQTAVSKGIEQLVILGAGLDTRPYRLPGMENMKVFEVDLPSVQNDKIKNIQKHLGQLPENISFMPIDFDKQTLDSAFTGTAFNPSRPAVFIWEGVTQYISEEAVRQTLAFVGKSAPGSMIVFTYILKSVIERRSDIRNANKWMDVVAEKAPWIFGLEPSGIQAYLKPFHLSLLADVGKVDYQKKYLQPIKRNLTIFEGERIVQAVVTRP
jgi:methyltransferase (TIGR00027 family)